MIQAHEMRFSTWLWERIFHEELALRPGSGHHGHCWCSADLLPGSVDSGSFLVEKRLLHGVFFWVPGSCSKRTGWFLVFCLVFFFFFSPFFFFFLLLLLLLENNLWDFGMGPAFQMSGFWVKWTWHLARCMEKWNHQRGVLMRKSSGLCLESTHRFGAPIWSVFSPNSK